jgi:hypothetical protein
VLQLDRLHRARGMGDCVFGRYRSIHPSINQLGRASGTPVSEQPTAAVSHDQGQQPAPNHWLALTLLCGGRGAKDCLGGRLTFTYLSLAGYATLPSCKLPSASTRSLECCAASQASPCRPRRRRPCAPVLAALHTPERPSRQCVSVSVLTSPCTPPTLHRCNCSTTPDWPHI